LATENSQFGLKNEEQLKPNKLIAEVSDLLGKFLGFLPSFVQSLKLKVRCRRKFPLTEKTGQIETI
jgi:hypothetical protein